MEEHGMLPNIRQHSLVVGRIADLLAELLQEKGGKTPSPNRQLCVIGALLHDIAKTPCLSSGCDHARKGAEVCRRLGYPELAEIVEQHVVLKDFSLQRCGQGIFSAKEIVYYADKRVRHDEIVSLEERLEYILHNYGQNDPDLHRLIRENFSQCVRLEQCLFDCFDFSPDQLADQVAGRHCCMEYLC